MRASKELREPKARRDKKDNGASKELRATKDRKASRVKKDNKASKETQGLKV